MDHELLRTTDGQPRLDEVYELMREVSLQTEPQEMVRAYARRMDKLFPVDRRISISRRGLSEPTYRVTRNSQWKEEINPWKQRDELPLHSGGLFADLLYSDQPHLIDDLQVGEDDPAAAYLVGQRSLMAIPMLDQGVAMNMVIVTREAPAAFDHDRFPDNVWLTNLFGRATHNLVLSEQLREAYEIVDRELKLVATIQRALLPKQMPDIEGMELAAYYRTSHRAGGDYYDFFPLPDGKWGILIADVSGHGTPAAVVMAITHTIAHMFPGMSKPAGELLTFVNHHLSSRYTDDGVEAFVTAFYAIFDPQTQTLEYSSAGHNPPRLVRCGTSEALSLNKAANLPLGVMKDVQYTNETIQLQSGDRVVMYTDGLTEANDGKGKLYGTARLDQVIEHTCGQPSDDVIQSIISSVESFSHDSGPADDQTLLVAQVK